MNTLKEQQKPVEDALTDTKEGAFEKAISTVINKFNMENDSNTPDFILATYLKNCLYAYNMAVQGRDKWFSVDMWTEDKQLPIPKAQEQKPVIDYRVKKDMICPVTKEHCDDECCPVGTYCNLMGDDLYPNDKQPVEYRVVPDDNNYGTGEIFHNNRKEEPIDLGSSKPTEKDMEWAREQVKKDEISFAEWLGDWDDKGGEHGINPFLLRSDGRWIAACGNSTSWTTEQLYDMYLKEGKQ